MKRYYLSPIIGTGAWGDAFRPKLADIPGITSFVTEIQTGPDGKPTTPWALCMVSGNKHGSIIADQSIAALPDVTLDVKISAIHTATKAKFKDDCVKFGIPTSLVDNADGFRDSVRGIGRLLNPNFNENNFDVSE